MRISGALVSATALFVLGSMPRLAEAQCGVTDGDYIVNEAQGTIVAWTTVHEIFTEYCPWVGGYQWGYFEHHYATTVQIESPTGRSAYGEDYQAMAYGGGSATAYTSILYYGDPGEYDIDYFIGVFCTIGGTLGYWFDSETVEVSAQTSCPLPPYQFHQMFPYGGGLMSVVPTGTLSNGQLDVTAKVYTVSQNTFDIFQSGVTSVWNKTFTGPDMNMALNIQLNRHSVSGAHDVFVEMSIELPPGGPNSNPEPDNCGTFTPGPGAMPDHILIRDNDVCHSPELVSAHEFGHDMRFSNAYVEDMCPSALHCDMTDIMACGVAAHPYHAQLLWERLP
jgi:hypothetical protein